MKLLLHACCGPCSLEPVRLLQEAGHDITIAYMNSNIAPADEYQHRLSTLLDWAKSQGIPVIKGPYEPERWQEVIREAWRPSELSDDLPGCEADTKPEVETTIKPKAGIDAKINDEPANNSSDNSFTSIPGNDLANFSDSKSQTSTFCHIINTFDDNLDGSRNNALQEEHIIESPGNAAVLSSLMQKAPNTGKVIFGKTKTAAITNSDFNTNTHNNSAVKISDNENATTVYSAAISTKNSVTVSAANFANTPTTNLESTLAPVAASTLKAHATYETGIDPEFDPVRDPRFAHLYNNRDDRCRACYRLRLEELARYAHDHGYDAIGTTLSVSPYQYTSIIKEELERAASLHEGLTAVFEDYRPYYPNATKRSRDIGMYRQNYCGCAFSDKEAQAERAARKAARKKKKEEERRAKLEALTTDDFDYDLPEELIAQEPASIRDECRLLVMKRDTGTLEDKIFKDIIDYLQPGDLLVANETRVMPARLIGHKRETGGTAEVFLLREAKQGATRTNQEATWEALVRPGKRLKPGAIVDFVASDAGGKNQNMSDSNSTSQSKNDIVLSAEIIDWVEGAQKGERLVHLATTLPSLDEALHAVGHTPLPPYIKNYAGDEELYQTVYSHEERSAAAPTAGLHFTPELIERIKSKGIGWETVHLEVGLDTFRIVEEDNPHDHQIHTERYTVPQRTVDAIKRTKDQGGRVIAVGTTSVRSLESAWDTDRGLIARDREATSLYILPGYEFKVVDGLITNFHVPRSTLMMLVSAFSTRENIMKAYRHAIKRKYRMLSFGDAMFIR